MVHVEPRYQMSLRLMVHPPALHWLGCNTSRYENINQSQSLDTQPRSYHMNLFIKYNNEDLKHLAK